jgi:predicted RNA-binding protein with PIN domain
MANWLIDGMNVIGSRPDGWWEDRPGAMRRLVTDLERFAAAHRVTVVLDSRPFDLDTDRVEVVFAPGGPDAADDEIVRRVRSGPDPTALVVVTSDKRLVEAVEAEGAAVVSSGTFRQMVDEGTVD